jgi:hypothetical protein
MVRILHWNGKDIPKELRDLPAGKYVLEAVEDAPDLTPDDEQGLRDALASLRDGRGRSLDDVRRSIHDAIE